MLFFALIEIGLMAVKTQFAFCNSRSACPRQPRLHVSDASYFCGAPRPHISNRKKSQNRAWFLLRKSWQPPNQKTNAHKPVPLAANIWGRPAGQVFGPGSMQPTDCPAHFYRPKPCTYVQSLKNIANATVCIKSYINASIKKILMRCKQKRFFAAIIPIPKKQT
jgi:hypothetical protein